MKNIKLLAAFDTLKMISVGVASALIAYFALQYVSLQTFLYAFSVTFVVFMIYIIYSINVTRREYQQISKVDQSKE
jgi:membrane protein implicated in regulation of membrane protease activity